jgi:hypothetical protein
MTINGTAAKLVPLSEDQRSNALHAARIKIVGEMKLPAEPRIEDYNVSSFSNMPDWFNKSINRASLFMLVVAFIPSAMRLHQIGLESFQPVIKHAFSAYVAAICVVFMAEIGQVIFTLSAANVRGFNRIGMYVGAAICTVIALSGNGIAVGEGATKNIFTFLETYGPPVLVLLTSTALKWQAVNAIKARHAAESAFKADHDAWESDVARVETQWRDAYDNAHTHHSWMRLQANALREALRRANARSTVALRDLQDMDWRALIERELNADQWFERTQVAYAIESAAVRSDAIRITRPVGALPRGTQVAGGRAGKHTGELDGAITANADGTHTAACPSCDASFTKSSHRSAVGALVAHTRHAHRITQTEVNANGDL